jgi:exonuclease SbcC
MIPVRLRLTGFLSYQETTELDFTSFDLACVSGANGAGKSTLLDAITWALFGQARRRDDALINSHATAAEVVFDFQYEGDLYRIQRSKPRDKSTILEFYIQDGQERWRPLSERVLRETELRIQQTLHMDYETFTNASFFLQGRADQFAQQRPGDRKRILSSILSLEIWEEYRERAASRRKRHETETAAINGQLEEINSELAQEDERRARLKQLEEDLAQLGELRQARENALENVRRLASSLAEQKRLVDLLATQLQAAQTRLGASESELAVRRAEQDRLKSQVADAAKVEKAYQAWQAARHELERWEAVAANFRHHSERRAGPLVEIEKARSTLEQELRALKIQQEQADGLLEQTPVLEGDLQAAQEVIQGIHTRLERLPQLQQDLENWQDQRSQARTENERLKIEMNELKERIERLKATDGAVCPLCGQPLSQEDRARLIGELEGQGRERGDRFRANQALLANSEQKRAEVEAETANLRNLEQNELRYQERKVAGLEERLGQMRIAVEVWRAGGEQRLVEVLQVLEAEKFALESRAALAEVDAALKELGYDASTHDEVRRSEQDGRAAEGQLRQLEAARAGLAPLEREIARLDQQRAADQAEADRQEAVWSQANAQYLDAAEALPDLDQAERELYAIAEQENRLRMQVGGARQQVEVLKILKQRQADLIQRRDELVRLVARLKLLERAFSKDGVPSLLIEQALPEIESQANEILDRLSAGGMSVRFSTQRDYKDKNREDKKETLDILISDAAGMREYELFSGGEAFRVNFAIRLALSRVLSQRAGARLQTLVIDEGFGSQDADGRQRLVEAINLVRPDFAKVLVITHLEELKDHFPARIEVEKTPSGSVLRVV